MEYKASEEIENFKKKFNDRSYMSEKVCTTNDSTSLYNVICATDQMRQELKPYNKLFITESKKLIKRSNMHMKLRKKEYHGVYCSNIIFTVEDGLLGCRIYFNDNNRFKKEPLYISIALFGDELDEFDSIPLPINNAFNSNMTLEEKEKIKESIKPSVFYIKNQLKDFFIGLKNFSDKFNIDYAWNYTDNTGFWIGDEFIKARIDLKEKNNTVISFTNPDDLMIAEKLDVLDYLDQCGNDFAKRTKININDLNPIIRDYVKNYLGLNKNKVISKN